MKLTVICKEPFPNGMAASKRIICYAKALAMQGIECQVLVYSRLKKEDHLRNKETTGNYEGVNFKYFGKTTLKPSRKLFRIMAECSDKHKLKKYLKSSLSEGDAVLVFLNGDISLMCDIAHIVQKKKAKFVKELCEIPYFGSDTKESRQGYDKTVRLLFPLCDGFITISDPLTELALKYKSENAKVIKIPILVDFDKVSAEDRSSKAGYPYIFHSGTLSENKDGILGMLEAFGLALPHMESDYKFVFSGRLEDCPERYRAEEIIKRFNLENRIIWTGFLFDEEWKKYLSEASLTIINKHYNTQNVNCFSTKLAEYLAAGKAVIISDVGEAMNWLEDGKNAVVVKRDDIQALADAIIRVAGDRESKNRIGENGRELCKKAFDYRSRSNDLGEFFKNL